MFTQLAPKTDINLAPSNWLRRAAGLRPSLLISGSRSYPQVDITKKNSFSSLGMADSHIAMVGHIDVVSDAEVCIHLQAHGLLFLYSQTSES